MEPSSRKSRCPLGFSPLQIAIISVLKGCASVIAYWQTAERVTSAYGLRATEGMTRGAMERMFKRGFLVRNRAASGRAQGNRYGFSADPCPHILPCGIAMDTGMESGMESAAQSGKNAAPSILQEKTDRKNLSISSGEDEKQKVIRRLEALTEEDIAFHWPELARQGFGTDQIRQIIGRLAQQGKGLERITQGLTHAEWELAAGKMRDKDGNLVTSPVSWTFAILARQGYYPRPKGYISPEEQAERDAALECSQRKAAIEARQTAALEAWAAELSPEERKSLVEPKTGQFRMPEQVLLRQHFLSEIWPNIRKAESKEADHET
jgi:hypothetical protein